MQIGARTVPSVASLKPYAEACDFIAKMVTEITDIRKVQLDLREYAKGDSFTDLARRSNAEEDTNGKNNIDFDYLLHFTLRQADANIHLLPTLCVVCLP